ncbi:MAG: molybdopterin molybdotransferase MoeA [Alphaproteobacteria bacterium]|nr:molybdopterin molybdotransferase MoeA [Alphaproteobacteria bacterium]
MIQVAEAQARILAEMPVMPTEQVGLADALGRVLSTPVTARTTQPPVALSAMDGYAVRATDVAQTPVVLNIVDHIPAGKMSDRHISKGEAARIFTGAPLPDGADAIVIQENTDYDPGKSDTDTVTVRQGAAAGRYVRQAGLDFSAGEELLGAGERLGPRAVGLAAAMNVPWLMVHRKPRIAILATGDEIVLPGETVGATRIVSSNNFALAGLIRNAGGVPVDLGIARDDATDLEARASAAVGCDMLVTSGGASVGEHDLVQQVLGRLGLTVDFWKIAMRPGKPLMFGRFDMRGAMMEMIGLPGNPVSSLVCGLLFVGPAVAKMTGRTDTAPKTARAVLGSDVPANDHRQTYLRAMLVSDGDGPAKATPFPVQDSSMLRTLHEAQCLIVRAPGAPPASVGSDIEILTLDEL